MLIEKLPDTANVALGGVALFATFFGITDLLNERRHRRMRKTG